MPPKSQLKYPDMSLTIRVNSSQIITSLSGCPSPLLGRAIRKLEVQKWEKAFFTEWNSILTGFFRILPSLHVHEKIIQVILQIKLSKFYFDLILNTTLPKAWLLNNYIFRNLSQSLNWPFCVDVILRELNLCSRVCDRPSLVTIPRTSKCVFKSDVPSPYTVYQLKRFILTILHYYLIENYIYTQNKIYMKICITYIARNYENFKSRQRCC